MASRLNNRQPLQVDALPLRRIWVWFVRSLGEKDERIRRRDDWIRENQENPRNKTNSLVVSYHLLVNPSWPLLVNILRQLPSMASISLSMDLRHERQKKIGLRVIHLNPEINARAMVARRVTPSQALRLGKVWLLESKAFQEQPSII